MADPTMGAIGGIAEGIQGALGMYSDAKLRQSKRKGLRRRYGDLRVTQELKRKSDKEDLLKRAQSDVGLEGGLAEHRRGRMQEVQTRGDQLLARDAADTKDAYKNQRKQALMDIANRALQILGAGASGLSSLAGPAPEPMSALEASPDQGVADMVPQADIDARNSFLNLMKQNPGRPMVG